MCTESQPKTLPFGSGSSTDLNPGFVPAGALTAPPTTELTLGTKSLGSWLSSQPPPLLLPRLNTRYVNESP